MRRQAWGLTSTEMFAIAQLYSICNYVSLFLPNFPREGMPVDEMSGRDCRTVKSITPWNCQQNMEFHHKSCFTVKIITSDPFNYITIGFYIIYESYNGDCIYLFHGQEWMGIML